jgi:hypothetical protein
MPLPTLPFCRSENISLLDSLSCLRDHVSGTVAIEFETVGRKLLLACFVKDIC